MFERFRKRKNGTEHMRAKKRNGERLGHLGVTANLKDGRLSFNVRTMGSFESFENDKTVSEIMRMREWFREEAKDNPNIYFFDRSRKKHSWF